MQQLAQKPISSGPMNHPKRLTSPRTTSSFNDRRANTYDIKRDTTWSSGRHVARESGYNDNESFDCYDLSYLEHVRDEYAVFSKASWTYGLGDVEKAPSADIFVKAAQSNFSSLVSFRRKRHEKIITAKLRAWAALFGRSRKVLDLELSLRMRNKAWMSPSISFNITVISVRSSIDPIFDACRRCDLEQVKTLFETGQASVTDVDEDGNSLLHYVVSLIPTSSRHICLIHTPCMEILEF